MPNNDWMFRKLDVKEAETFRAWARANFIPGKLINACWHPIVRAECKRMNAADTEDPEEDLWERCGECTELLYACICD